MSDLASLLEKVRSAQGADSDLDRELVNALGFRARAGRMSYRDPPMWVDFGSSAVTRSIDAALALVERLLGVDAKALCYSYDLGWHASAHAKMAYTANLHLAIGNPAEMHTAHGQATTLPLAILSSLLTALITAYGVRVTP